MYGLSKYKVNTKTITAVCNGLLQQNSSAADDLMIRESLEPTSGPVYAYAAKLVRGGKLVEVGELQPRVVKLKDGVRDGQTSFEVVPLLFPLAAENQTVSPEILETVQKFEHNLAFLFYPPLQPEEDVCYELRYAIKIKGLLTDVLEQKEDVFCYTCEEHDIEQLNLVFEVPGKMNISLEELPERWREKLVGLGLLSKKTKTNWVKLEKMTDAELSSIDNTSDFVCQGWSVQNLKSGDAVALLAHP